MKKFNSEEELWQQNLIDIKRISKDIPNNNSHLTEETPQVFSLLDELAINRYNIK